MVDDDEARRRALEEAQRKAEEEARRRAAEEEALRKMHEAEDLRNRSMLCPHGNIIGQCALCR
jgi:hypothetical protein